MSEAFKFSLSGCGDVGWLKFDAAKADKTPSMRQSLRSVRNAHHSTESYKTKSAQREHSPGPTLSPESDYWLASRISTQIASAPSLNARVSGGIGRYGRSTACH
jgi:hypothetical protein